MLIGDQEKAGKVVTDLIDDRTLRANTYAILAALLSRPPTEDLIDYLRHIDSSVNQPTGDLGSAWIALKDAAMRTTPSLLDDEYHALFIGIGRGEVVPFGSWHMTGFLMEKPLSDLRDDLRALGIESDENVKDPEDHIAALCEVMSIVIHAEDINEPLERQLFIRHINPWATKFFKDLQEASSSDFYRHVGVLGQSFMALEAQYLNIQTH